MPAEGFEPIRAGGRGLRRAATISTILLGGNNAVTRPAAHGARPAARRDRPDHPRRPFRHARDRPGADERQSGPLPARGRPARARTSARSASPPSPIRGRCTRTRSPPGSSIWDIEQVLDEGIEAAIDAALEQLSHVEAIMVDFDIDVIDRAQLPGAPGARPGRPAGRATSSAPRGGSARRSGCAWSTSPSSIPSLDVSDISALTAGRWVCEILAGYSMRGAMTETDPQLADASRRRCAASPRR